MGGGLLQLAAYGSQDTYLTGNPQITFFKGVHYKHTHFSMESMEQTFGAEPGFGRKVSCNIQKTGDLIHKMYLEVELPALVQPTNGYTKTPPEYVGWTNKIGHSLIKNVEIVIGGEVYDKHNSEWLEIWSSMTNNHTKKEAHSLMIGERSDGINGAGEVISGRKALKLYIPLHFWFCKKIGNSIPLVALQHQDVKVNIEFRAVDELLRTDSANTSVTTPTLTSVSLFVDYIFLDNKERKMFVEKNHEYIIEQVQYAGEETIRLDANKFYTHLPFTQPVKAIYWTITNENRLAKQYYSEGNCLLEFGPNLAASTPEIEFKTATIKVNGVERYSPRSAEYHRLVQPYNHHSAIPTNKFIYMYSFCLDPEDIHPTGSCNFSKLDISTLNLEFTSGGAYYSDLRLKIFAINYNVMRIMSGMAGLAFTN